MDKVGIAEPVGWSSWSILGVKADTDAADVGGTAFTTTERCFRVPQEEREHRAKLGSVLKALTETVP